MGVDPRKFPQGQGVAQHGQRLPGTYIDEVRESQRQEVINPVEEKVDEPPLQSSESQSQNGQPTVENADSSENSQPTSTSTEGSSVQTAEQNTTQPSTSETPIGDSVEAETESNDGSNA